MRYAQDLTCQFVLPLLLFPCLAGSLCRTRLGLDWGRQNPRLRSGFWRNPQVCTHPITPISRLRNQGIIAVRGRTGSLGTLQAKKYRGRHTSCVSFVRRRARAERVSAEKVPQRPRLIAGSPFVMLLVRGMGSVHRSFTANSTQAPGRLP
jgi:hypothetical protein